MALIEEFFEITCDENKPSHLASAGRQTAAFKASLM